LIQWRNNSFTTIMPLKKW